MHNWMIGLFIFAAIAVAMAGQAWVSWLEHKRRTQALDLVKMALEAGEEPPALLYEELRHDTKSKAPWTEVVLFGALGFGFWLAFAFADADRRVAFLVIATTMTATALGCLALALFGPYRHSKHGDDEQP